MHLLYADVKSQGPLTLSPTLTNLLPGKQGEHFCLGNGCPGLVEAGGTGEWRGT